MMYRKVLLLFSAVSLMALSCKTTEDPTDFELSNLPGMIYDGDNRPCERVRVEVFRLTYEGEEQLYSVETDINGRFTLPGLDRGDYRLSAEKRGYESLRTVISYASRTEVLYLKMYSRQQILALAADALERGRYGETETFLARSASIEEDDPEHLYLEAIYRYRIGDYETSLISLQSILDRGFDFPWVHLLMGDIYQYELADGDKALEALKKFSRQVEDSEVIERIKELENR